MPSICSINCSYQYSLSSYSEKKKIDDMLDIYLRIPIADPHASCVPWVNYFNFSVPHFLIHKMGVIVGTTHISVRNIIYTSIYGQLSSVAQSCLTLCDPIDCSMPGFPVYHQLPELAQTHVHRVSDTIQPSHALSSPSPSAFYLSRHQGLFQLGSRRNI